MTQPTTTLDPFSTVAGKLIVDGVAHDVLHLTGREYRRLNGGAGNVIDAFDIAERIVPSLGDRVWDFTGIQVGAIIGVADGRVAEVELHFPNSSGPTLSSENEAPARVS